MHQTMMYTAEISMQPSLWISLTLLVLRCRMTSVMCTIFWDAEGVLLIDFMPHKVTVTAVYYGDLLHKLCLRLHRMLSYKHLHTLIPSVYPQATATA